MKEKKLFMILTDLAFHTIFYVDAIDMIDAANKAIQIVTLCDKDKHVLKIALIDTPLITLE